MKTSQKIFDTKLIFLLLLIAVITSLMLLFSPPDSLDQKIYYTGEEARKLLNSFDLEQLRRYLITELLDLVLITSYSLALIAALSRLYYNKLVSIALPLFVGFCDLVETVTIIAVLKLNLSLASLDWLGVFTLLKWSFGALAFLLFIFGLLKKNFSLSR